jgi:hypothetical protein
MSGGTGVVPLSSELKRKAWVMEGLVQAASKSFWSPFTGGSMTSVVYQETDISASAGHTVVFDFDGNISGKAVKGKDTAYGRGEQKRKFSDKITVERYRLVVDNGDKFDGVDIGDLSINEHADSRAKLGDLWIRFKDQMIFDAAQGLLGQAPSHVIDLGTSFTFNDLINIETVVKTSNGFTTGSTRRPLDPYTLQSGEKVWLFVIDSAMAAMLRKDTTGYQTIMAQSDTRGENNRNIKGVIGRVGSLLIVCAEQFFGETSGSTPGWGLNDSSVEISGLRQYSGATASSSAWTGQASFNYASATLHSRGVILGAGGIQLAMGKMPDYKIQPSPDFGISSESCLEVWTAVRKTYMTAENTDYSAAKIAGLDFGVIAVDVEVQ